MIDRWPWMIKTICTTDRYVGEGLDDHPAALPSLKFMTSSNGILDTHEILDAQISDGYKSLYSD